MDAANIDIESLLKENEALKSELEESNKRFYDLVKKTNVHLKNLFDSSNDLIQILKPDGEFRFVNRAWKYKIGYTDLEVEDLNFLDVIHPDRKAETRTKVLHVDEGTNYERFSTILVSKLGKNIYVNGNVTYVYEKEDLVEIRIIFYDVTERMRAESAQSLYYTIASYTAGEQNIQDFFEQIYNELSLHLKVRNFSIAIQTDEDFHFSVRINEKANQTESQKLDQALSAYTLKRARPLIIYQDGIKKIAADFQIDHVDDLPKIWLGVPFDADYIKGVMMMYSYRDHTTYNNKDLELLDFISGQVSLALQKKHSEAKIINQGARLEAIFESSTHQIWSIDKKYCFTSFNENYARAFEFNFSKRPDLGTSLAEVYGEFFDKEVKDFWIEKYEQAFAGNVVNFQTGYNNKHERTIWRDVYLNPIFLPNGEIQEVSVIANDITEKKASDEALIKSEEKFRSIFESFQDVYFRCDIDGKINMISPSISEVIGYLPKDVIGNDITAFFRTEDQREDLLKMLIKRKSLRNYEASSQTKDGASIKFICNIRLISTPNDEYQIEGVARDITELIKANEQLKEAKDVAERSLKIKERFLANMSHEIRTPMNGLIGMIDLIGSTRLSEKQKDYVKTLKLSSDNLLHILNDILDLSKIEAGKMEFRKEPVKLVETIEKIYDLYSQHAYEKNTELYYNLDDNLPEYIVADETRLTQIISNLTSNAIKFSDGKGPVHINIRVEENMGIAHKFYVAVKDAGIGINPQDQESLFKSFSQIDSSNKKTYGGTGLGLAISKELVKNMGGDIGVVSTPGLGSTFWFTFIAEEADQELIDKYRITPVEVHKFEQHKPKILLVDDNQINRKVASEILSQSGCKVTLASDGFGAIELVEKKDFDLIFMDIQMPEMDGLETTKKIKQIKKNLPPIIAMTAYSMEEDRQKFLKEGLDDYLSKPIKSNLILGKVKEWTQFEPKIVTKDKEEVKTQELIINQNTLNQLHKFGGSELIHSVLEEFDEEATELVNSAIEALKNSEFEKIRSEMHTLKGNAGTLGIERVSKFATTIEKRLKENNFEGLENQLAKLNQSLFEFKESYKNLIN